MSGRRQREETSAKLGQLVEAVAKAKLATTDTMSSVFAFARELRAWTWSQPTGEVVSDGGGRRSVH